MSILFAASGFTASDWRPKIEAFAGGRAVAVHGEDDYDTAAIRYALVWKPPSGLLASLPKLEVVFNLGAGVDALAADPTLPDCPLVRAVEPDMTMRMTEWIVLQVLTHHRQALAYLDQQRSREWRDLDQPPASAVRVGMMGMGTLGSDAADVLRRLGFQVAGWSRTPKTVDGVEMFSGDAGLDRFLRRTDILVVLLPLTDATRGILNMNLFEKLARNGALPGPILINAGRGGLQVEADILKALSTGALEAASLDVFETEPLSEVHPFWSHPRVIVTPHVAAVSDPTAICRNILGQIDAYERGEPLQNVVDLKVGY
ncbi:2-hydroxyacid dehydrogenase [Amorphus orientalis]|uniref:Glyoxylate/hydroxypyruvate reductase A n=1 Tax=Amorphus orientalis TaxID=649198 RepID=A0AAE3VSH1_9HYPH|nr:glyoxylate/hydroxypyruvate reductase A [Amorphus orientalis]MDQ0317375.1 glyoxylate/hydroxypyruvate reductase A [Amorphus orientalis]